MTLRRALPLALGAVLAAIVVAATGVADQTPTSARLTVKPTRGTFISLVPACACSRHTELEEFSVDSGRLRLRLGSVTPGGYAVGLPATTTRGEIVLLATSGPRCDATGVSLECPKLVPDSCRNIVEAVAPGQSTLRTLFTLPGSDAVGNAVPSPDGSRVALTVGPCTGTRGTTGLFVRDVASGQTHPVVASENPCDAYGRPAWNPSGTMLAFAFAHAEGRPRTIVGGGLLCPGGRQRLAIVPATDAMTDITLLSPDPHCEFPAAAWDRVGIVVAEGCSKGSPHGFFSSNLGHAYLKQFNGHDHAVATFALDLGLEQAVLATDPYSGDVLVTQDQPANEGYPERDWVWRFDGHHLRPIAHYAADDAAQVLAVPW